MRESKVIKEIMCIRERQAAVEMEMRSIKEDVGEIKVSIRDINKKITNNITNGRMQNAVQNVKIGAWVWFMRVTSITIMSALITKLLSLW